jgi:hypothetical protein
MKERGFDAAGFYAGNMKDTQYTNNTQAFTHVMIGFI